jgi:radical SAM protein with 4Fe4S-binding SPASM domain
MDWLCNPPTFLQKTNAIIFLNYKPAGRDTDKELLLNKSLLLPEFFRLVTKNNFPFRIGFDSCSVSGLLRWGTVAELSVEHCDAGRFSLFVSETLDVYPCSFMVSSSYPAASLKSHSLIEIWETHPTFLKIRMQHKTSKCSACGIRECQLSGCPLFPEMDLCSAKVLM